jgi:hypothetical protein
MGFFGPPSVNSLKETYLKLLPKCAAANYNFSLNPSLKKEVDEFLDDLTKTMGGNTAEIRHLVDRPVLSGGHVRKLNALREEQRLMSSWLQTITEKKIQSARQAR